MARICDNKTAAYINKYDCDDNIDYYNGIGHRQSDAQYLRNGVSDRDMVTKDHHS